MHTAPDLLPGIIVVEAHATGRIRFSPRRGARVSRPEPYWIRTFFCWVLTPPREFCAVTVITLSPFGNGGVK